MVPSREIRLFPPSPLRGSILEIPADTTPGEARTESSSDFIKRFRSACLAIARVGQVEIHDEHLFRGETFIDFEQIHQTAQEQAACDQANRAEPDFDADEQRSQPSRRASFRSARSRFHGK